MRCMRATDMTRERIRSTRDEKPAINEKRVPGTEDVAGGRAHRGNRVGHGIKQPGVVDVAASVVSSVVFITPEVQDLAGMQ